MIYFENRRYAQKNPTTKIKRDRNQNIGERSEIKKPTAFCLWGFAEMLFRPESLEEFASQSGFSMDGRPSSYERSNVQSRSDFSWKMTLLYGVDRGDTSLPKVRFCICHPPAIVLAQGFEIAFQGLPTTAVPTRSGQGTGTMPKGSKNSCTALRTPG